MVKQILLKLLNIILILNYGFNVDEEIKILLVFGVIAIIFIAYVYTSSNYQQPQNYKNITNNTSQNQYNQNKTQIQHKQNTVNVIIYTIENNNMYPIEDNITFIHISLRPINRDFYIYDINSTCKYYVFLSTGIRTNYLKINKNVTMDFILGVNMTNATCNIKIGDKLINIEIVDNKTTKVTIR